MSLELSVCSFGFGRNHGVLRKGTVNARFPLPPLPPLCAHLYICVYVWAHKRILLYVSASLPSSFLLASTVCPSEERFVDASSVRQTFPKSSVSRMHMRYYDVCILLLLLL